MSGRPATTCGWASAGPTSVARRSATHSSVPSHGMSGCDHCSQHSRAPSGEMRGSDTKSGPDTSARGASSPVVSSTTISLTTSAGPPPGGWCSRTTSSQRPPASSVPSAHLSPRGTSGSAVTGTGIDLPVSRYRRWSPQLANHTVRPATHHAPPPYSWAAVRALNPSGRRSTAGPSPTRWTSCVRPPSSGRCSDHVTTFPCTVTAPRPAAARTTSSDVTGVDQDP